VLAAAAGDPVSSRFHAISNLKDELIHPDRAGKLEARSDAWEVPERKAEGPVSPPFGP
jgi:hypothetical protein